MLDWFDRHMKAMRAGEAQPSIQYAVQSVESADRLSLELRDAETWPPTDRMDQSLYLAPDDVLSEVTFTGEFRESVAADTSTPRMTLGGRNLVIESGVMRQPELDRDEAIAVFAEAPTDETRLIAGEVRLETTITADVPNVDVHARLIVPIIP